ncbi:hypothetical protein PSP6_110028 [Paraburkholderia tropica]|nr:hypothetical protein PSP6_110028 [Paraburkholderia tropica]
MFQSYSRITRMRRIAHGSCGGTHQDDRCSSAGLATKKERHPIEREQWTKMNFSGFLNVCPPPKYAHTCSPLPLSNLAIPRTQRLLLN